MSIILKQQKSSNGAKNIIKKISKFTPHLLKHLFNKTLIFLQKGAGFIASRMFYFVSGLLFSIAIVAVYATLPTVNSGDILTSAGWNAIVSKVNSLDVITTNLENRAPSHVDCYEVNLSSTASCVSGYFFTYIERSSCPGVYCKGTCCKPW